VVYGANASGKSNLIKAMDCMNAVICNSAGYKLSDKIPVTPFLFDEKTKTEPTTFEATFFIENIRYQYGFSATIEKIHKEWLLAWPTGKKPQTWFERGLNTEDPYFGPNLKGQNKSTWGKVKGNSLFLSVAAQFNHKQLSHVYKWFDRFRELPDKFKATEITDNLIFIDKNSKEPVGFHDMAVKMFRQADFGVNDFAIDKFNVENIVFPDDMPVEVQEKFLEDFSERPRYLKTLYHCDQKYSLPLDEESEGTQRFYSFFGPLLESATFGYTIYKDELELNLHPLLTREIVRSVINGEVDNISAQLIFTTHDTTLLDPELFGRDQIWFTEKDKDGATQLYSLADYKETVRKDEAMQKRYLAGRYGAVPVLERFDLVGTKKK